MVAKWQAEAVDRNEKKRLRDIIGEYLDVSNTRLTDNEAVFLVHDFIERYDEFRGRSETRRSSHRSFSSDGRYTRTEEYTYTFTDDVGIREDYQYRDDDGQTGGFTREIRDARGILEYFKSQP